MEDSVVEYVCIVKKTQDACMSIGSLAVGTILPRGYRISKFGGNILTWP